MIRIDRHGKRGRWRASVSRVGTGGCLLREVTACPDHEIVVLGAGSAEALRKTHGRYFHPRAVVDVGKLPARA